MSREREKARKRWAVDHGLPLSWYLRTYRSAALQLRSKRGKKVAGPEQKQRETVSARPPVGERRSARHLRPDVSTAEESSNDSDDFQDQGIEFCGVSVPSTSRCCMNPAFP